MNSKPTPDQRLGPLEEPADQWFVNRKEELDLFWKWATGIPHSGSRSYALIGLWRTGKTAILHKVFNRLFREQDRVTPIYISFARYLHRSTPIDAYEFAEEYFTGLVRSYLAFRYRKGELLRDQVSYQQLWEVAQQVGDEPVLEWFRLYQGAKTRNDEQVRAHSLMQWVINFPKGYAWGQNQPMAILIDEFQVLTHVYNPDNKLFRNVADSFQAAAETSWAPLLVSGSSISMLVGEALSGLLSGRFRPWHLEPLAQEHAIQMVYRIGQARGMAVTEELALAIWGITRGYPYSIERLMTSDAPAIQRLPDVNVLSEIVLYELLQKRGTLWEHYEGEYGKYIRQLNGDQTTRKILFWITSHPDQPIYPDKVAEALNLDLLTVQGSLEKLYKTDVIQRASISTFTGPADPLLREFLRYEHYIDIEHLSDEAAQANLQQQLHKIQGEMNRQTGHFTEIIVAGVLNNFDDRTVAGATYFGLPAAVKLPRMEIIRRREGLLLAGELHEIDVIGEYKLYNGQVGNAGLGAWLVSVRYRTKKMGVGEVEAFIQHADALQTEKQYGAMTRWFFSKTGFSAPAIARMQAAGIYFSGLKEFNELAILLGLLPLAM